MYGRWLKAARPRLDGLRLDLLTALAPTGRYLPAFLFPPSTQPWGDLASELKRIAASPPAMVRAELDKVREGQPLPAVLRPLYDDPAGQLPEVAEERHGTGRPRSSRSGSGSVPSAPQTSPTAWSNSPTAAWPGCWPPCTPTSPSPTSC